MGTVSEMQKNLQNLSVGEVAMLEESLLRGKAGIARRLT